jgi:hypothetical protein
VVAASRSEITGRLSSPAHSVAERMFDWLDDPLGVGTDAR